MNIKKFNYRPLIALAVVIVVLIATIGITLGVRVGYYRDDWNKAFQFLISTVLVKNFFGSATILIGSIVFAGYIILGRTVTDSFLGMIKAMIGVIMLKIGSGVLVGMAKPIFENIKNFGAQVVPLDPYFVWNDSAEFLKNLNAGYEAWISYALILGFVINIFMVIFRKWTNAHSIMLTGHVMFQQSAVVVPVTYFLIFHNPASEASIGAVIGTILISSLVLGLYWSIASTATIKGTDAVTGNAGFAVGHQQMLGLSIAYGIGKFFGNKEDSAEDKKLSNKIKIFEDNIFTQTLLIFFLFFILILIIQFAPHGENVKNFAEAGGVVSKVYSGWNVDAQFWGINVILGAMKIVASILVLQAGVRMFVTELQQSFQGIADKVIPGGVIAVDVAATYGFAMNSVTYGFAAGTIAQFIAVGVLIGLSKATNGAIPIAIPLFITLFFNSGSIGVFANASGGYKASIIVPAIFGFIEVIVIALGIFALGKYQLQLGSLTRPFQNGFLGMFDWNFFFGITLLVGSWNPVLAGIVIGAGLPIALIVLSQLIDSNRQTKATALQRLFKIKPNLMETH